jgi:hypothetical protein
LPPDRKLKTPNCARQQIGLLSAGLIKHSVEAERGFDLSAAAGQRPADQLFGSAQPVGHGPLGHPE